MLRLLKRWLGKGEVSASGGTAPRRPTSATADVLANGVRTPEPARRSPASMPAAARSMSLQTDGDKAAKPEFDPYNTGNFDRSASWERISRNQR